MTRAQEIILKYFQQRTPGAVEAIPAGAGELRVNGKLYGVNIFCDILEVRPGGENRIIARSDSPHGITAPMMLPTKWEDLPQ